MLPLKGIKVVDLTRILAGPTCTMLLGDLGASIIKIEEPLKGDDTRSWLPPAAPLKFNAAARHLPPESAYFLSTNRNKKSLALNIKDSIGQSIIKNLVKNSDVLVENFLPGKLSQYGLDYDSLKEINPSLIYASISGYGSTGPKASKRGYDVLIEAEAGLMHITGEPNGNPVKVGVAITDITTGLYAHGAILAALFNKLRTNEGVHLDLSLFESQIASLSSIASNYLVTGKEATKHGTSHPSIVPYQTFQSKDGHIMIGAGNDGQFKSLAKALGKDNWINDEKFSTNANRVKHRNQLVEELSQILSEDSVDNWCRKFEGNIFSFGPVNNMQRTFEHPQSIARNVVTEIEHPRIGNLKITSPAVKYGEDKMKVRLPPPYLGQHTFEVLQEEGYTLEDLIKYQDKGIIVDNNDHYRQSKL